MIQPGGGIVTAGWRTTAAGVDFALTRHDASGNLDHSFGTGGIATTDLGGDDDEAYDAALLPDGGIVAVGRTDAAGFTKLDFGVARYRPDGTPDPGFGSDGIVKTDILGGGDQANAVAVQPDGKIVVAGFARPQRHRQRLRARPLQRRRHARPRASAAAGIVTTDLGTQADDARALVDPARRQDRRRRQRGRGHRHSRATRPTAASTPRSGTAATTVTDLGSDDVANGVALTADGQIVIAGYTLGAARQPRLPARPLHAPTAASTPPSATTAPSRPTSAAATTSPRTSLVDAHGRIVLVGRATSATILDMALVRYNADGTLDTGFDGDGILTADFHGRGEFGQDLALDAAGRIVAAGYTANGADTEFALLRTNP